MTKLVFKKEYTRDYSLIIEQLWDKVLYEDFFGNTNPYKVINIYYINDGVMEVWENKEAIKWFVNQLYKKNQEDSDFFHSKMDEYIDILTKLKNIWSKKYTKSLRELKAFISLSTQAMNYFVIFYYTAMDDRNRLDILDKAIKIRDEDEFFDATDNFIRNSIENIYPETKDLANTLMIEELDNLPDKDILKARYKNYVVDIVQKSAEDISLKDFAIKNKNYSFIFDKIKDAKGIKGQIAFKGKAQGKVRILKRKNQVSEFKDGEILISPMTTPDFVPAMKRAAAIVTDEGGIVCHAAILARELKKPCVIATKFATKIFKDGDIVEVDANKGIVKKLK